MGNLLIVFTNKEKLKVLGYKPDEVDSQLESFDRSKPFYFLAEGKSKNIAKMKSSSFSELKALLVFDELFKESSEENPLEELSDIFDRIYIIHHKAPPIELLKTKIDSFSGKCFLKRGKHEYIANGKPPPKTLLYKKVVDLLEASTNYRVNMNGVGEGHEFNEILDDIIKEFSDPYLDAKLDILNMCLDPKNWEDEKISDKLERIDPEEVAHFCKFKEMAASPHSVFDDNYIKALRDLRKKWLYDPNDG